jgi:hypothetical protein
LDVPETIPLDEAIMALPYSELRQYTTTEINALIIPAGKIVEVWDKTLGVKKLWNGNMWKIIPTTN